MERSHLLEVAFRSRLFDRDKDLELVETFYPDIYNLTQNDSRLVHNLVVYNKFNIFCNIVDGMTIEMEEGKAKNLKNRFEVFTSNADFLIKTTNQSSYLIDDISIDVVDVCFKYDNTPFLLKAYLKYRENIESVTIKVQALFTKNVLYKLKKEKQFTYIFEFLYILRSMSTSSVVLTENVIKFVNIMKRAIKREPKLNMFSTCYNPIKLCVLLIDLIKFFNTNVYTLDEDLKQLEEEIVKNTLAIISDVEVPGVLRYWLYDEIDEERKVIDLLAHLNLLTILNHTNVARTVEHIWRGTYDCNKTLNLEATLTRGVIAQTFRSFYVPVDTFFTTIGPKKNGSIFYYTFKLLFSVIKNSVKTNKTNHILFEEAEKSKLPTYGFVAYTDTIYLQFFIDTIILILYVIAICILVLYETQSRRKLETTYSTITTLQSQTQTTSVLASIETNYALLSSYGETWIYRFKWMIVLNTYTISCLIQDLMVVLTYVVRGISLKLLSPNFMLLITANFIHFILAINFIYVYFTEYNIDRTLTRSEEKNYKIMMSTFNDSVGSYTVFNFLVFYLGGRIMFQFVYFEMFGVLVQIITKMIFNAVKFLFFCLLFVILFTIVANIMYFDISNYATFYDSFVSMYSSALGGFAFTDFDSSTHVSYYSKKIMLAAYLLITVVMLMNFLIAILSDTYSFYLTQTRSLQMKEIIKLRAIYEPNPYYSCLVKAPLFLNAYMILFAPFVVIFKSKKLNKAILFMEHFIVVILFVIALSILIIIVFVPVLLLFLVHKVINYKKFVKTSNEHIIRIIDFFLSMFVSPFLLGVLAITHVIGETMALYKTHILRNVEVHKNENKFINDLMDITLPHHKETLDNFQLSKMYYAFKKFTNTNSSLKVVYDPSNHQLSEVVICIIIATMKIVKRDFRDLNGDYVHDDTVPLYVPTKYVILELRKNLFVDEQLRSLLVGPTYKRKQSINNERLEMLVSYLADCSLGGTNVNPDNSKLTEDPYLKDTGCNYIFLMASMKSHEERKRFWREKILTLFTECSQQWVLDQYHFAKIYLQLNSFEAEPSDVTQNMVEFIGKIIDSENDQEARRSITKATITKQMRGEDWDDANEEANNKTISDIYIAKMQRLLNSKGKLQMIDIPSLMYPVSSFEANARQIYREDTNSGAVVIPRKVYKQLIRDNESAIRSFASSKFSSSHRAFKSAFETSE